MKSKIDLANKPDRSKVFNRFYIADQTRKNGRGLGLSIVQSLVEKTGGLSRAKMEGDVFSVICTWKLKGK